MQRNRQLKRNRNALDIEVDRELEAQPEPSPAQQAKKASGEARRDRHYKNTWHAKKAKRHTVMRGVCAAGLEAGVVVASEVVEARVVTQLEAWVEACSMRALLGSLLLGLAVRGWFTRLWVLPDGQEVFEEIPAELAVIPDLANRNMYLQLIRGLPPPSRRSQPSEAVEDVLALYPGLHDRLKAVPRYPHDSNTVDDVGTKLETNFANSLTELFPRRVEQAVALAGSGCSPGVWCWCMSSGPAGWLRPVRSMAKRSRIRGLMCSTSNGIRFYDRDVSAALNIARIAAGPGRPRELSSWRGRPAMPNPGRPGQDQQHSLSRRLSIRNMTAANTTLLTTRITESLIRRRAEHNDGMLSNLEEVALHQQNIGQIEALGRLCPHLKILYLQNNLISKLENLHKLKELEYLNMAVNNVTRIQNLQRCESLRKLDLTINFVDLAGLLTISSLQVMPQSGQMTCHAMLTPCSAARCMVHGAWHMQHAPTACVQGLVHLQELTLMGNPCTEWSGYRPYVIAKLARLTKLVSSCSAVQDGVDVKRSERIAALQQLPGLEAQLRAAVIEQGLDPDLVSKQVEDDSLYDEEGKVKETGSLDEVSGEMRRPWCPATRLLDHMEMTKMNQEAEARKKSGASKGLEDGSGRPSRHQDFPVIQDGERIMQRNEGRWEFSMEENDKGDALELEVDAGKYLDTSLIKADVQPTYVRLLIKGKLLQLLLPCEVKPDASSAQRSQATGRLVLTMPKEDKLAPLNIALLRPKQASAAAQGQSAQLTAHATKRLTKPCAPEQGEDSGSEGELQGAAAEVEGQGRLQPEQALRKQRAAVTGVLNNLKLGQAYKLKAVRKATVVASSHGGGAGGGGDDDDDALPDL
ncbi:hypothetical protein QJQ45_024441 [Haematococcus lacustris]|nr:hypothetical protein QJQ45_024441 [Haematococcus lacustris]